MRRSCCECAYMTRCGHRWGRPAPTALAGAARMMSCCVCVPLKTQGLLHRLFSSRHAAADVADAAAAAAAASHSAPNQPLACRAAAGPAIPAPPCHPTVTHDTREQLRPNLRPSMQHSTGTWRAHTQQQHPQQQHIIDQPAVECPSSTWPTAPVSRTHRCSPLTVPLSGWTPKP